MIRFEGDEIIFSSGRRLYANHLLIGINLGYGHLEISSGYDDHIIYDLGPGYTRSDDLLTVDEQRDLADAMIERWQRFKDTLR